jgi:hypothetical protein
MARGRIHDLFYSWKRKSIFGTYLVETSVVDAHSKPLAGLGVDNRVGKPPWVVDLPNEAGIEQLLDLFTDEVLLLNRLLLGLLLDRSGVRVDLQMVLNHLLGDPRHCDGCQANTSILAQRKVMSTSSYLLPRSPAMRAV